MAPSEADAAVLQNVSRAISAECSGKAGDEESECMAAVAKTEIGKRASEECQETQGEEAEQCMFTAVKRIMGSLDGGGNAGSTGPRILH